MDNQKRGKLKYFCILIFAVTLGVFAFMGDSSWAADEISISVRGEILSPQVPYEMKTRTLQLQLQTTDEILNNDDYQIIWRIAKPGEEASGAESDVARIEPDGQLKNIGIVTALAPGQVEITAAVIKKQTGATGAGVSDVATIATTTCLIDVMFAIDTSGNDAIYKDVDGDGDRDLVLYQGNWERLSPTFGDAKNTQWVIESVSQNDDEVASVEQWDRDSDGSPQDEMMKDSDGKIRAGTVLALGAGKTTVKATYTPPDSGGETRYAYLDVYVIPRASDTDGNYRTSLDATLNPGEYLYTDTLFVNNNETIQGKIDWVIMQDDSEGHAVVIADSIRESSDLISMTPTASRSNQLRVVGEAGQYDIYFYIHGTYTNQENFSKAYTPTHVRLTIKASIEDKKDILHIGDSYNFAEAYNMTAEDFLDCFESPVLTANDGDYNNYADWDPATATVTAKAESELKAIIKIKPNKKDRIKKLLGTEGDIPDSFTTILQVIDGIYLNRSNMTISVGQSEQLNVKFSGTYEGSVTWKSSNETFVKVSPTGLVTGLRVTTDDVAVTATLDAGNGVYKTATCIVKVEAGVDKFTLSPGDDQQMLVGEHLTVVANIRQTVTVAPIRWVSSNPEIFSVEPSADKKSAVITALKGGTADLIAYNTSQANDPGVRFRVTVRVPIDTIKFAKEEYVIGMYKEGYNMNSQISYAPKNATDTELVWSCSDPNVATVDEDGYVTFKSPGTTLVRVYPAYNPYNVMAITTLTVLSSPESMEFSEQEFDLNVKETKAIDVNFKPENSTADLEFTPTEKGMVDISFDEERRIVSFTGRKPGDVGVNVVSSNGLIYNLKIHVKQPSTAVKIDPQELILATGASFQLNAKLTPADSTDSVTWKSFDTKIATVDKNGLVTGKAMGTTFVQATTSTGFTNVIQVTVRDGVKGVKLDSYEKNVYLDESITLSPIFTPETAYNKKMKWTVANTKVATIQSVGDSDVKVTGAGIGNTIVTGVSEDGGYTVACMITVTENPNIKIPATEVKIVPEELVVLSGETYTLQAEMTPADSTDTLKWESFDPSIATVDETTGEVAGIKPGITFVQVTTSSGPTNVIQVEVRDGLKGVSLDAYEKEVEKGEAITITPIFMPETAYNKEMTWSIVNPKVATIEPSGISDVIVRGVELGTTLLTGVSSDGEFEVTCMIIVKENTSIRIPSTDVKIIPEELVVMSGESYALQAEMTPVNSTDTLKWHSFDTDIAEVDEFGVVKGIAPGKTFIQVTTSSGATNMIQVEVRDGLKGISLDAYEKQVTEGETITVTPIFEPETAYNKGMKWTISNPGVASLEVSGVSDVKVKGNKAGSALLTGVAEDGGFEVTCLIIVNAKVIESSPSPSPVPTVKPTAKPSPTPKGKTKVSVSPTTKKVNKGKKFKIKVTVTTSSKNKKVKWSTSNKKICKVSQSGKVTAKKIGTAYIKAKAKDGSGVSAKCKVRVIRPVTKLTLNRYTGKMLVGNMLKLKATVKPKNATIKKLKWTTSDKTIATVSADGQVLGLAAGMVKIHVKTTDGTKKKATCLLEVREPVEATGVTVENTQITLVKGKAVQSGIVAEPANATTGIKYHSDNPAVASIDQHGKITTHRVGHATVYGETSNGRVGYCDVLVVDLNRKAIEMRQYDTEQLSVNLIDEGVTWYSKDINIATVDANGLVTGRRKGITTVYANVNGVKLGCRVKIKKIK